MSKFTITTETTEIALSAGQAREIVYKIENQTDGSADATVEIEWLASQGSADWVDVVTGREVRLTARQSREVMVRFEAPKAPPKDALNKPLHFQLVLRSAEGQHPDRSDPATVRITGGADWSRLALIAGGVVVGLGVVVGILVALIPDDDPKPPPVPKRLVKERDTPLYSVLGNRAYAMVNQQGSVTVAPSAECASKSNADKCIWSIFRDSETEELLIATRDDRYLGADQDGRVTLLAKAESARPDARWQVDRNPNVSFSFKSHGGKLGFLQIIGRSVNAKGTGRAESNQFQYSVPLHLRRSASEAKQTVWLVRAGSKRIEVIKEVRTASGLGLKEAKKLVDEAPSVVVKDVPTAKAIEVRKALEKAGATVRVE